MLRFFSFILVIVCLFSCDFSNKTNEEYEILSLVYKEFIENEEWGGEMPPPPQKYPKSWNYDSIPMTSQDSQIVAKLQNEQEIRNQEWLKKIKSRERNVLVDIQYSGCYQNPASKEVNYDYLDLDKIKRTNKYKLKEYIEFQKIDTLNVLVISFSYIEFNEKRNKASLELGISQGKNWGFSLIIFLEKINKKWKIIDNHIISVS